MKKSTIKLIAMLLTVVLMLPNFAGAGALNENEVDDGLLTWEEVEEISRLETPAIKAHEEIIKAWTDEQGNIVYPETFGGCYLNDTYKLTIKLLNNDEQLRTEIIHVVNDPSVLRFENTDVSLAELQSMQNNIQQLLPSYVVTSSEISQRSSSIVVTVLSDDSDVMSLSNDIDPHILIKVGGYPTPTAASLNPGEMFSSTAGNASLGWMGKFDFDGDGSTSDCILIAGHVAAVLKKEQATIEVAGTPIAGAAAYESSNSYFSSINQGYSSAVGDYALIACSTSKLKKSNKVPMNGATVTVQHLGTMVENETIVGKSYGISGYNAGKVRSVWANANYDNIYAYNVAVSGLVSIDPLAAGAVFSEEGDSGTPVFAIRNNYFALCGIVSGCRDGEEYIGSELYGDGLVTPIATITAQGFIPYLG